MEVLSQTTPRLLMSLISVLASLEKTVPGPMDCLHMSPSVVSKNKLATSQITRSEDSGFKPSICENKLSFTFRRAQYPYFHRRVKPGLGSPSRKHDIQWHLDRSRKKITYQCPGAKGSISSPVSVLA